jgi:hypothetical protein
MNTRHGGRSPRKHPNLPVGCKPIHLKRYFGTSWHNAKKVFVIADAYDSDLTTESSCMEVRIEVEQCWREHKDDDHSTHSHEVAGMAIVEGKSQKEVSDHRPVLRCAALYSDAPTSYCRSRW